MASDVEFVKYVVDQLDEDCDVTYKKMFGEYGLYSGGKLFGLICDDQLFVKPTDGGRALLGEPVEAPPYPGAKPNFLIGAQLEDREWLSRRWSGPRCWSCPRRRSGARGAEGGAAETEGAAGPHRQPCRDPGSPPPLRGYSPR